MIYKQLNEYDFYLECKESFSYIASMMLYEHLNEIEDNHKFDLVKLRCEYGEYKNLEDYNKDTGYNFTSKSELSQHTHVLFNNKTDIMVVQHH